jgi:CheY-like chemotaxis protein
MTAQKVLIVNGSPAVLGLLEAVLAEGRYDVVCIESDEHAYSQVRKMQPDMVVLCTTLDRPEALQVLSMIKLDGATRDIPVLTCVTTGGSDRSGAPPAERAEPDLFARQSELWMN